MFCFNRDIQGDFQITAHSWWNTTREDSGPWFFRPMTINSPWNYPQGEDLLPRRPCFEWDYELDDYKRLSSPSSCLDEATVTIGKAGIAAIFKGGIIKVVFYLDRETGVQYGGPRIAGSRSWSFTFFLPYEMNFMKDFSIEAENHPTGCNFPDPYPMWDDPATKPDAEIAGRIPINCTRSTYKLPGK